MALDEPQDNDQVFHEKGLTFIVNTELYEEAKPISIDFVQSVMGAGFMVKSELSRKSEGGCGSGSGSCSC